MSESPGEILATYGLGSCIGLAVYDPQARVGGLLHFMLPDSSIDAAGSAGNPFKFADTGIPQLLQMVCGRGASKRRLIARAAGGASMVAGADVFEIGKRNYVAMRRILWKAGLLLHAEAMGGTQFRTMKLEIGNGRLWLLEGGGPSELLAGIPPKGADSWHTAS
jgi:chemotaxis protein CheD